MHNAFLLRRRWVRTLAFAGIAASASGLSALPLAAQTPAASTPIQFVPPTRKIVAVSKTNAANAWPLVNSATKALESNNAQQALELYTQAQKLDPTNEFAANGKGTALLILGRFADAAQVFRNFLALKPDDARALRGLADALTYSRQYREALGVNNYILSLTPNDFAAQFQNAQVLTYAGNYEASEPFFSRASQLKANDPAVWTAWGESLSFRRNPRALNAFGRALSLRPNYVPALVGRGNYYVYTSDFSKAVPDLQAAVRAEPSNLMALVALGDALTFADRPREALPYYRTALGVNANNVAARLGLGRALVYAGQKSEGATELRRVLAREPNNAQAIEALAVAQADTAPAQALASYERLLRSQTDPARRAQTLAVIGDLRLGRADGQGAIEAYRQAAQLAPGDARIQLGYAQVLSYEGQFEAATVPAERVLASDPNNARALAILTQAATRTGDNNRAAELSQRLQNLNIESPAVAVEVADALREAGDPAGAQALLERVAPTASDPQTALRIANAVRDGGNYEAAGAIYSRLIERNPNNVEARLGYAQTLIYARQLDQARTQLDQVLRLDADNTEAQVLSATVALRRDTPEARVEAERQANEILRRDPNNADARVIVAEVLTSRQRFTDAIPQFRDALQADPNNLEARLGLARNLYYARDVEGAIEQYRELIRRAPADTLPRLELARVFLDRSRFAEAEALFNEVLTLRRGGLTALSSRGVDILSLARLDPFMRELSPLLPQSVWVRANARISPDRISHSSDAENPARPAQQADAVVPAPIEIARRLMAQTFPQAPSASPSPGQTLPSPSPSVPTPTSPDAPEGTVPEASAPPLPSPDNGETATEIPIPPIPPIPAVPSTTLSPLPGGARPSTVVPGSAAAPGFGASVLTSPLDAQGDQGAALRGLGEIRRRQGRFEEAAAFFNQALALNENDASARIGLAQALRGQRQFANALREIERSLAADPTSLQGRVLRAQLLADAGQTAQAQQAFDQLLASLPENPPLDDLLILALALNEQRNYEASLQLLTVANELYPNDPSPQRLRAETLTFAGRTTEALAAFDQLIAANPNDLDAQLGRARVFNYSNQLTESEAAYRAILTAQPENFQALAELADVVGRQANYTESIRLYAAALTRNPSDLALRVELARVQRYAAQPDQAEASLSAVLAADPNYVPALVERGVLRGVEGQYPTALADLNRALEIAPNDLNARFALAEVQGYAGNYDQSLAAYREALALDPTNARARTDYALVLSYAGQNEAALRELDSVLSTTPRDTNARLARADVLTRAGRTTEAINAYNVLISEDPQNRRARTGLADAFLFARRYDDAVGVYDQLLSTEPDNTTYLVQRARALGYGGRSREAVTALQAILVSDPDNQNARLALAEAATNSGDATLQRVGIQEYNRVLVEQPTNVSARVGLARAQSYVGQYDAAKNNLNQVLEVQPNNTEARLALAETQRFEGSFFDARDNYRRVVQAEPVGSEARSTAQASLSSIRRYTSSSLRLGGSYYNDSNGVQLRSFAVNPVLRTRAGAFGVIVERGEFEFNDIERDRNFLGLTYGNTFGPIAVGATIGNLEYDGAPDRTLFDVNAQLTRSERQRYFASVARRDVFETDLAVDAGITATVYRAGFAYPLGRSFDFEGQAVYTNYSDDNSRLTLLPSLYYRFRPTNPSLRIGIGYTYDDTEEARNAPFVYYTPQDFHSASLLADYVVGTGRTRYGVFGALALTDETGEVNNRPADTLFGFIEHDVNNTFGLFANGGIVRAPDFDSEQITAGVDIRF